MPSRILNLFGSDVPGRFKLLGAVVVAACALIALGFTLVYRFNVNEELRRQNNGLLRQTEQNCLAIERLKAAIVLVFEDGRANLEAQRSALTPDEYQARLRYYDRQFRRFSPSPCPENERR